tara:strand:- start:377 stop:529 length:153 start_codon:yes stop_codon:yes gene_type:complete
MAVADRFEKLQKLAAAGANNDGILSNAKCLGEGVDVPTLDGFAFSLTTKI